MPREQSTFSKIATGVLVSACTALIVGVIGAVSRQDVLEERIDHVRADLVNVTAKLDLILSRTNP